MNKDKEQNATHLFRKPGPGTGFHNSESWWSAVFSWLLVYGGNHNDFPAVPTRLWNGSRYVYGKEKIECQGLRPSDVLVEPALRGEPFGLTTWPTDFGNLRPDILVLSSDRRDAILIENKTVGAPIKHKELSTYPEIASLLQRAGWNASFLLLLSVGCEGVSNRTWQIIERKTIRLILWEDVLKIMDSTSVFRELFDVNLKPYYHAVLNRLAE